jgi:hypothetical protein
MQCWLFALRANTNIRICPQIDKNQSYTDIFRIASIPVCPITARSESARRFDNRKEKSREMSVQGKYKYPYLPSNIKKSQCKICDK